MRLSHLSALLVLGGVLSLGGCVSMQPSQFYQLQSGASALPTAQDGAAVLLGPVNLADYLKRETLVQRLADGSLKMDGGLRWAGSLEDDVSRVLLRQLAGELDTSRLALYPDRVGFTPDAQILLDIARLDSGPTEPAVLEAHWRLLDGSGRMRDSQVVRLQASHDGSVAGQVRAQSELLRQLSESLAGAVRPVVVKRPAEPRRPVAKAPEKPAEQGVRKPGPVRTEMEVFRF